MTKRKAFEDDSTDDLGFTDLELTEMFTYTNGDRPGYDLFLPRHLLHLEQNLPTISIKILRPLFSAIDDLFTDFEIFRVRDELSENESIGMAMSAPLIISYTILKTCFPSKSFDILGRIEQMWLSTRGPGFVAPLYGVDGNHSYGVYTYRCMRRVVFSTHNNCLLQLESITKYSKHFKSFRVDSFPGYTVEDIIPALVGLALWRDGSIYYQIQTLQQSPFQHIRETTHKFTELLRPLCKTFEQVETSLDPLKRMTLFSSRKRCTKQQMKLLRDNLHGDKEKTMKSTLQSFMSTSTSKRFCTQFHEVDCQTQECEYKMPPMLMTITVEPEALKLCVFIPVYWYIIENETGQSTHEYEVLIFPGVEMEFHTLRCDKEDECGPRDAIMTMSVKIIGFEPDKSALNCTPHTGCQIAHNQLVNNLSGAIVALMI